MVGNGLKNAWADDGSALGRAGWCHGVSVASPDRFRETVVGWCAKQEEILREHLSKVHDNLARLVREAPMYDKDALRQSAYSILGEK